MNGPRRHRMRRAATAAVPLLLTVPLLAATASAASTPGFTRTEKLTRTHLVNGADQVVDTRSFTVSVDRTTALRDRQPIDVTWSGAHPTGGVVGDEQSALAADEEYPVVLMQCRGVDSTKVPVAQRLSPKTCWTHTPAERARFDTFSFPPYRIDRYSTPADRQAVVGAPNPLPSSCSAISGETQHWVPFVAADGKVYPGGYNGCAGQPPEAVDIESSLQPSNTTYGVTGLDGKGQAKFVINTDESNASLGCSAVVACSLVIVPIMGVSCDPAGTGLPAADQPPNATFRDLAMKRCSGTGRYSPGQLSSGFPDSEDLAVSGDLWWTASNWRNHISVPLTFAAPDNVCNVSSKNAPLYVYGSQLLVQATTQWAPTFCLNPKLFRFVHVQAPEPEAKSLLQVGTIDAAFASNAPPGGFPADRRVVQAPTALTGFGIAYDVDGTNGAPYLHLRLTPRLLAKLMTESYASNSTVKDEYPALSHNPIDIAADPEFQALNPGVPSFLLHPEPASTLFSLSSDSDLLSALTSYINTDPEARAWLDGKPDPWGMTVNPNYKGISLPTNSWPLRDLSEPTTLYGPNNPCLATKPPPGPWLPLVAAPVQSMQTIAINMQFNIANSQIACANPGANNQKLTSVGREDPGHRFILGLVALGDAARFRLPTAELQSNVAATAPVQFTDATGRTFVAATNGALRAAGKMLRWSKALGTWPVPYQRLRTDTGKTAYPGTMLVSTDVPTRGLSAPDAKRYAQLLTFIATTGQTPGTGNGRLPAGYLPLTRANGLSALSAYTRQVASAVASQGVPPAAPPPTRAPQVGNGGTRPGTNGAPSMSAVGNPPPTSAGSATPGRSSAASSALPVAATGRTPLVGVGALGLGLPLVVLVMVVGMLASAAIWYLGSERPPAPGRAP